MCDPAAVPPRSDQLPTHIGQHGVAHELGQGSCGLIPSSAGVFGMVVSDLNELIVIDRNDYTLLKYALSP